MRQRRLMTSLAANAIIEGDGENICGKARLLLGWGFYDLGTSCGSAHPYRIPVIHIITEYQTGWLNE